MHVYIVGGVSEDYVTFFPLLHMKGQGLPCASHFIPNISLVSALLYVAAPQIRKYQSNLAAALGKKRPSQILLLLLGTG